MAGIETSTSSWWDSGWLYPSGDKRSRIFYVGYQVKEETDTYVTFTVTYKCGSFEINSYPMDIYVGISYERTDDTSVNSYKQVQDAWEWDPVGPVGGGTTMYPSDGYYSRDITIYKDDSTWWCYAYIYRTNCNPAFAGTTYTKDWFLLQPISSAPVKPGCQINFDAAFGTNPPEPQKAFCGEATPLVSTKPQRSNYTFHSWNTVWDGSGSSYQPGENITPGGDIRLYAIWTPNSCEIVFDGNGGTIGGKAIVTEHSPYNSLVDLPSAQKKDRVFLGWSRTKDDASTQIDTNAFTVFQNEHLYALWGPIWEKSADIKLNYTNTPPKQILIPSNQAVKGVYIKN